MERRNNGEREKRNIRIADRAIHSIVEKSLLRAAKKASTCEYCGIHTRFKTDGLCSECWPKFYEKRDVDDFIYHRIDE